MIWITSIRLQTFGFRIQHKSTLVLHSYFQLWPPINRDEKNEAMLIKEDLFDVSHSTEQLTCVESYVKHVCTCCIYFLSHPGSCLMHHYWSKEKLLRLRGRRSRWASWLRGMLHTCDGDPAQTSRGVPWLRGSFHKSLIFLLCPYVNLLLKAPEHFPKLFFSRRVSLFDRLAVVQRHARWKGWPLCVCAASGTFTVLSRRCRASLSFPLETQSMC